MMNQLYSIGMLVLMWLASLSVAFSQHKHAEINKIKKDRNYLTATGTSAVSEEDALNKAREQIDVLVVQWLSENATGDISGYVAKSKESLTVIDTKRGNLFRSFVYVKKQEILPYYKGEVIISDLPQEHPIEAEVTTSTSQLKEVKPTDITDTVVPIYKSKEEMSSIAQPAKEEMKGIPNPVIGISHSEEEQTMMKILSVSALGNYLKQLYQKGRLSDFNEDSAWPQEGTVYFFVADYNEVIRVRMKLEQGVATDLSSGERIELKSILTQYESGSFFWMTLK